VKAVSFFIEGIYIMVKSLGQSIFIDNSGNTTLNLNGTIIKKDPSGGIVASDASNNTLDGTFNNIDVSGNATINGNVGIGKTTIGVALDVSGNINTSGDLVVSGNITVSGTTTTINSTTVTVQDPIITLGSDVSNNKDKGIEFKYGTSKIGFFGYDDSTGNLTFLKDASNNSEVFTGTQGTIEGSTFNSTVSSGTAPLTVTSTTLVNNLNADMLDGLDNSKFMRTDISTSTTGSISVADGTAATPILTFTNDSNTGFYRPGNDILGFSTAGGEKMRIDASGNVGIGVTSMTSKLAVLGFTSLQGSTVIGGSTSSDQHTIQGHMLHTYVGTQTACAINQKGTGKIFELIDSTVPVLTVLDGGNVGIGTNNPQYKLHVEDLVYFPKGIISPGIQAQSVLSGGGKATWNGSRLLWSQRVIAIPIEREWGTSGYLDINCPTSGTITYQDNLGNVVAVTCDANGIPLNDWDALWYVVTPGQNNTSVQAKFVITGHLNINWRPTSNWLLLALRNTDSVSNYIKWLPGQANLYTWIAPTLSGTWTNYDTLFNQAGYYKDTSNRVYFRGLVKGGSGIIFTLPVGYRPERRELLATVTNPNVIGRCDITNTGVVSMDSGNNTWFSLDGLSFLAV